MSELEPIELIILRPEDKSRIKINEMKRRLAKELKVHLSEIGHCIDKTRHRVYGYNTRFTTMREKEKPHANPVLVVNKPDGRQEIVPHTYIGSHVHPIDQSKYVHFYYTQKHR